VIRVGLLGCGRMGQLHARKLAARSDAALVGVVDPAGVAAGLPAVDALGDVDAVIVATPAHTHGIALPWLQAGVPCLIEKPLASTVAGAESLAPFAHASVNHLERYNPALVALGPCTPSYLRAERLSVGGPRGLDVDVVHDLMIHDLDLALHWLGPAHDVRAVGVAVRSGSVDIAEAWVECARGVATFTASRVSRKSQRTLRVVDPRAYWSLDLQTGACLRVDWRDGGLEGVPVPSPGGDALESMHDAFFAAVAGEGEFPVPAAQAAQAVALADRVVRALQRS
jgi:predicted dehydrogenase